MQIINTPGPGISKCKKSLKTLSAQGEGEVFWRPYVQMEEGRSLVEVLRIYKKGFRNIPASK